MKIRKAQLDRFESASEDELIVDIVDHLRENHGRLIDSLPLEDVREMVRGGIQRARRYGIHPSEDLAAFVSVMFEIAPNFDEQYKINKLLRNTSIPLKQRWEMLFDDSMAQAWEEAEDRYDPDAWFTDLNRPDGTDDG